MVILQSHTLDNRLSVSGRLPCWSQTSNAFGRVCVLASSQHYREWPNKNSGGERADSSPSGAVVGGLPVASSQADE